MSDPKAPAPLSTEQFLELVKELRKPADPTEAQLAQAENDRAMREETALRQRERLENKAAEQSACVHRRKDRSTHCVFEYQGGYLICQGCQGIIRPEPRPTVPKAKETSHHIYNTRLFNEHFAETQAGATTF